MEVINYIKEKYENIVRDNCQERGTGKFLKLGQLGKHSVVLHVEKAENVNDKEKCDCIIITYHSNKEKFFLFLIELKSKVTTNFKVFNQINECSKFIEVLISNDSFIMKHIIKNWDFLPFFISDPITDIADKYARSKKTCRKSPTLGFEKKSEMFFLKNIIKLFERSKKIENINYKLPNHKGNYTLEIIFKLYFEN